LKCSNVAMEHLWDCLFNSPLRKCPHPGSAHTHLPAVVV